MSPIPLTIATQNVCGMRGEFNLQHGPKHSMLRAILHKRTDFLILTETRANVASIPKIRVKWGMKPTHHSLSPSPHSGVIILSKRNIEIIQESKREATLPGHIAAAVYVVKGTRIIVAGIYGVPASNDTLSSALILELHSILQELKHLYQTQQILLAGDFNVAPRPQDSNSPQHISKPSTVRTLLTLMEDHNLIDLAIAANKPWHTWFRHSNQGQSSRIDLLLTNIATSNLKYRTTLLFLDHAFVEASFGLTREHSQPAMKDYILSSDEFLISAQDIMDNLLERCEDIPQLRDQEEGHSSPNTDESSNQPGDECHKQYNQTTTGHTALHLFNETLQQLHTLHNSIIKKSIAAQTEKLQQPSRNLLSLKKALKRNNTVQEKEKIHDQIREIQKTIQDDIEAKEMASQMRIANFYKSNTGKMVPETFSCIKELKRDRQITKLEHEGQIITDPDTIIDIMQKWYEETAQNEPEQTETLEQFIIDQQLVLPQLDKEQCDELEEEFTTAEVMQAIKDAKTISAPGPSGQTISIFKLMFLHNPQLITQALNQLVFVPHLATEKSLQWIQKRKVIYIPKKPVPLNPGDYRPLSMLEVLYKIPARILAARLTKTLPQLIGPHQHGFMPSKGIQEPSILATHLIQESNRTKKPLQLVSFDMEKAFDKVTHKVIIQALRAFGIPEIMVQAIQQFTLIGYAKVEVNGRQGILITIKTGSGQGDPLSSILFLLATEPLNRALATNNNNKMYVMEDGTTVGPILFADDNLNPLALNTAEDLTPIIDTYATYQQVSGLNINIRKSAALCINTPPEIIQGIQLLGIETPDHVKHLGIHLGKTINSTIEQTMKEIQPKAIKRRILATTPPTDLFHRSTLINMAFTPIYNHVFMAIPIDTNHSDQLIKEISLFLWTRQKEGEQIMKRRLVSKQRISAELSMGGLQISHPRDIIVGLQQNLIQRILEKGTRQIPSLLPQILNNILASNGRPTIEEHVDHLGPMQWRLSSTSIAAHNVMFSQALSSIATLLEYMEMTGPSWHCAAIYGHTLLGSHLLAITTPEAKILHDLSIKTLSQLLQQTISGGLEMSLKETVLQSLVGKPWLVFKLKALINKIKKQPLSLINKNCVEVTTCSLLIYNERHLSQQHKKNCTDQLSRDIKMAPAYQTRIRDEVYRPDSATFCDAYRVLQLPSLPSKTKEIAFQILNRTIWTNNKAFKSKMTNSPSCDRCDETETMEHLFYGCEHYSIPLWKEVSALLTCTITTIAGHEIAQIHLTPREIIFNAPHPAILLHVRDQHARLILLLLIQEIKRSIYYRRMNITDNTKQNTPIIRIQAHLMNVITKLQSYLSYLGASKNTEPALLLATMYNKLQERIE